MHCIGQKCWHSCISEWYCTAQKCCHSLFLQLWIYQFLMSFRSITYTNDLLAEFNIKITVSKSGYSYKILQYLAEPSKVLQICCSSFKFLWNWANTAVNLCAALKTESLFSLVSVLFTNNSDATLTMQETEDNFSHE